MYLTGGYQADVTYEGEAKYAPVEHKPSYPVQPYSKASEARPVYVQAAPAPKPEAKAAEVTTTAAPVEPEAVAAETVVKSIASPAPQAIRK